MSNWDELFPDGYLQAAREVEELYHIKWLLERIGLSVLQLQELVAEENKMLP